MFLYYFSAGILFFVFYFSLYALLYLHWVYSKMNPLNLLNKDFNPELTAAASSINRVFSFGSSGKLSADYRDGTVPISREMHKPSSIPACYIQKRKIREQ